MNFQLSDQQLLLREQLGRLFRQESTPARIRAAEPAGFDAALWRQLADFGAPLMRVPEEYGGSGVTLLDAVLIAEDIGQYLLSAPLIESMVATRLLALIGGELASAWLQRVMDDGDIITFLPSEAQDEGITKTPVIIPGAAVATAVIWLDGENVLISALSDAAETKASYLGALPHRQITLAHETAALLGSGQDAQHAYLASLEEWKLLTAAALIGASDKALRLAAAYAGERSAFGKLIGGFQGVAHPLADSITDIDGGRLLLWRAVWAISQDHADAAGSVSLAYWFAAQAMTKAVTRSIRVFGGYGMSMEYDIQLYFRRARGWSLAAGDPARELRRAGERLWGGLKPPLPDAGDIAMDFDWGQAGDRLAASTRSFFENNRALLKQDFSYVSDDAHDPALFQELAAARLLYPEWPEAYHGRDCDALEAAAVQEVFNDFGVPILVPVVTDMVGKMLLLAGTEEAQRELLPELATGRAYCSLGYSEPSGGSDIFAAKTRAVQDGDSWILNGQKMFTTQGHLADYALLLARTDPSLPKHAGLTLFVVPLRQPGYESHEVKTLGHERTNITYYTDMRIPDKYRLGEINGGTKVMGAALKLEQGVGLYNVGPLRRVLKHALAWAQRKPDGDAMMIDQPEVRSRLAKVYASILVADALTRRSIWAASTERSEKWYGSMSKLFGSEAWLSCTTDLMELAAPETLKIEPSDTGWIEIEYRRSVPSTIYGGTSEIHRSIIAEGALAMPRSRT